MRRSAAWGLALPLAFVGSQAAHSVAYALVYPQAHTRALTLFATGHAYLAWLPFAFGGAAAAAAVSLAVTAVDAARRRPARHVPAWAFALVPPAIHLAHGSSRDALASFAVRTVPIGLGFLLFGLTTRHTDCAEGCAQLAFPLFGAIGSGIGMIVDWAAFSSEPAPAVAIGPVLGPGGRGRGLGLALRF